MEQQEKQTVNEEHTEEQSSTYTAPVEEKSTGAIIGAVIIVVLLIVGGLYYFESRSNREPVPVSDKTAPSAKEISNETSTIVKSIETQGTSDKIDAIQKDIDKTNLKNIDVDLGNINAELGLPNATTTK